MGTDYEYTEGTEAYVDNNIQRRHEMCNNGMIKLMRSVVPIVITLNGKDLPGMCPAVLQQLVPHVKTETININIESVRMDSDGCWYVCTATYDDGTEGSFLIGSFLIRENDIWHVLDKSVEIAK